MMKGVIRSRKGFGREDILLLGQAQDEIKGTRSLTYMVWPSSAKLCVVYTFGNRRTDRIQWM
jgi:hypothetical protein